MTLGARLTIIASWLLAGLGLLLVLFAALGHGCLGTTRRNMLPDLLLTITLPSLALVLAAVSFHWNPAGVHAKPLWLFVPPVAVALVSLLVVVADLLHAPP